MNGGSDLRIHLSAALAHNEVARAALRTARPDRSHEAVARALARNEQSLRSALTVSSTIEPGSPAHSAQPVDGSAEDMERRALLRISSYAAVSTLTPLHALERLADVLNRRTHVQAGVLDAAEDATDALARRYYDAGTGDMRLAAAAHLERLNRLQQRPMAPADRVRLTRLVGDAALLVGSLAYDVGLAAQARAHYQLAQQSAREAADPAGYALALGFEALTRSKLMSGTGDSGHAAAQLRQATRLLPSTASARARAWLEAHAGKEAAATGDAGGFRSHLDAARQAIAAADHDDVEPGRGFVPAYLAYTRLPGWAGEYEARGLVLLGDRQAGDALDAVDGLVGVDNPRRTANLLTDRMRHHLRHREPAQAVEAGLGALRVSRPTGLRRVEDVVRSLHDSHRGQAGREMSALDDLLAAAS